MINLTEADVGRKVIYLGNRYPRGKSEEGIITSFNRQFVFVRYGKPGSEATRRDDLEYLENRK